MQIAVIGDIHANVTALEEALLTVDRRGCDRLIFLGDLLTYGVDVEETLEVIAERVISKGALLIRGNHDAMYEVESAMDGSYLNKLPVWIRECIDWTRSRIPSSLWSSLQFRDEVQIDSILISHANPFGPGCWDYINTVEQHTKAAQRIAERCSNVGVFGHTHRARWFRLSNGVGEFLALAAGVIDSKSTHVLNAGAIGQPRDDNNKNPHVLWVTSSVCGQETNIEFQQFSYDVSKHLKRIGSSGLSLETVKRVSSYFAV